MGRLGSLRDLVERDAEVEVIDRALAGAAAHEGSLVALAGPAGIGKTALLEVALERADAFGTVAVTARGTPLERGFPYGLVRQLLEPVVTTASASRRDRLLSGAAAFAAPAVLGPVTDVADPGSQAFAVLHGLYWLIANLAAEAPLAVILDDVHWADVPSLRFMLHLARRLDGLGVAMIISQRTDEPGPDQELVSELVQTAGSGPTTPRPLSVAGVRRMLRTIFGQAPPPGLARACREATRGNPLFIRELANALAAGGVPLSVDANEGIATVAPKSVARVTLAKVGRLSGDAVALAQALAVLGADANVRRATALAGLGESRALGALDALVSADVVAPSGSPHFRHPIVHAAIYDGLGRGARSSAHRRAAELLQDEGAALDAIAAHLMRTEPIGAPETIAILRRAAAQALAVGAPDSAVTYLTRALEEGPEHAVRVVVLLELGRAERLARDPAALVHFDEAGRLADDPTIRAGARLEQAEILAYVGEWQQARLLVDAALDELPERLEPLALRAEAIRGALTGYDPRHAGAHLARLPMLDELAERGGAAARPLNMHLAGWKALRDAPPEVIDRHLQRGWDDGRYLSEGDNVEMLAQGIGAYVASEELDRAAGLVDVVMSAARASGSVLHYLVATAHRAWVDSQRGRLTGAAGAMRDAIDGAMELGLFFPASMTLSYGIDVLIERPEAADLWSLAETLDLGDMMDFLAGAVLLGVRGRLRAQGGRTELAIADQRRAGEIAESVMVTSGSIIATWRSDLALMLGESDRDEAQSLVDAELAQARRIGRPRRIGIALRARGLVEPDHRRAMAALQESVAVLADSPARLEYARALVELGAARRRLGQRAGARPPLREGLDLAARCGAVRLAQRARVELVATGARPRREYTAGRDALTPSEIRVAEMAARGRSSREIAQALFVTTRTIDTHLNHAYAKLGIHSRRELPGALHRELTAPVPAGAG